jgi:hypothetical protein
MRTQSRRLCHPIPFRSWIKLTTKDEKSLITTVQVIVLTTPRMPATSDECGGCLNRLPRQDQLHRGTSRIRAPDGQLAAKYRRQRAPIRSPRSPTAQVRTLLKPATICGHKPTSCNAFKATNCNASSSPRTTLPTHHVYRVALKLGPVPTYSSGVMPSGNVLLLVMDDCRCSNR